MSEREIYIAPGRSPVRVRLRLKGVGPLLPPDSSVILAWADSDIAPQTITDLSPPARRA